MIIQTGEIATRYDLSGPDDAPVLLLMHSIGTSSFIWRESAALLSRRFRVVCPDFRGHGGSGVTAGPYTMRMLADDMGALCQALGVQSAHVGGLSLGGLVAQQMAADRPDLVESLVLCDTGLRLNPSQMWHERAAKVRAEGMKGLGDGIVERWITPDFIETDEGHRLAETLLSTDPEGYAGAAEAIATADFTATAAVIAVPTLIVVGEDDQATPLSLAEALRDAISNARLHIIPAARHIPSIEKPVETASAILDFLTADMDA